jgi:hybrid cluster-associated redox disulfide protein
VNADLLPDCQAMFDLDTPVDEVLARHPELASQFVRHRMICVGCAIARFHSVRDVAQMYELDPEQFLRDLRAVLARAGDGIDATPPSHA